MSRRKKDDAEEPAVFSLTLGNQTVVYGFLCHECTTIIQRYVELIGKKPDKKSSLRVAKSDEE